ncbi:MAG: nucleotide exchange factor GrpE [Gemmatimonadetes bacterium]|nr:nucleotide exchange factor GrpE [Gemmatimonadota bacterium]
MAESAEDVGNEEGAVSEVATAPESDEAAGAAESSDSDPIEVLRRQFEELNDRHLRLVAEFSNYRRRSDQERLGTWGRAQADVLSKFISVLDDLHRVAELDLSNATVEAIMEGIDLVEKKFSRMLEDAGVEVIDPVGERFDPQRMEALMRVSAELAEQDETVAQVMQKGYALKGSLIRPARVAVFKHG